MTTIKFDGQGRVTEIDGEVPDCAGCGDPLFVEGCLTSNLLVTSRGTYHDGCE